MHTGSGYSSGFQITGCDAVAVLQCKASPEALPIRTLKVKVGPRDLFDLCVKILTGKDCRFHVRSEMTTYELKALIQDRAGVPSD